MIGHQRCVPPEIAELNALINDADEKIEISLTVSGTKPTFGQLEFARRLLVLYGKGGKAFRFSPNHSDSGNRGYALEVAGDAPVSCAQFPRDMMFAGITAVPLDAGFASDKLANGSEIPNGYFGKASIKAKLSKYAEKLGKDPSAFVGVFTSEYRDGFTKKRRYWVVVQACNPEISQEFYEKIVEVEGTSTWDSVFASGHIVQKCIEDQRRHRAVIVFAAILACGLGPFHESKDPKVTASSVIDSKATISKTFNTIEKKRGGGFVYLSDMVSTKTISSSGTILCEPGKLGLVVLHGPWTFGEGAETVGFPVSTSSMQKGSQIGGDCSPCDVYFWASDAPKNPALSVLGARKRDDATWREIEKELGFNAKSGYTELTPLLVMLNSV